MTETVTLPSRATPATPAAHRGVRRVLYDSAYSLSAGVLALVAFVIVLIDLALGLALAVLVGGALLIPVGVMVARGFAAFERIRMRGMLGRAAPSPRYLCAPEGAGFWRRMLTPLRDPQSWLDVGWSLVGLVTGTFAFCLAVVWWAGVLGGLTYWFWQRWIPQSPDDHGLAYYLGLGDGRTAESLLNLALGLFFLLTLPAAMRFAALTHASVASVLLCSRAELQGEVARVQDSRDAARLAEADSLRRLERDIHDGPQQRLVRLSMDLGRARRQLEQDPARAAATIDEALAQTRETVAELRALSRGIAPPLLVDRGLAAALGEMLGQSVVPVTSRIELPAPLAPHVETAVYFVVAEALTNVAKHSGAETVLVTVVGSEGEVMVRVEDDGVGGAHPAKGSGLAGLRQRVVAADGTLEVSSPEGGPTVVEARISGAVRS